MIQLLAASLLWAFSFGLIKDQLTGLDPALVALIRLVLAGAVFLPFLVRAGRPSGPVMLRALALGAVQFGLMYVLYIAAYGHLPAWMVALFTVTTPFYVLLLAGLRDRSLPLRFPAAVALAIAGAAVVVARGMPAGAGWTGVLLLQGSNLCFAAGQVGYRNLKARNDLSDLALLGWMYLGSILVPLLFLLLRGMGPVPHINPGQWATLVYLGVAPTALGFYLWNKGAARVGAGFLAAVNNLKIPLAVLVAWTVFGEAADHLRAVLGLALVVAALFVAGAPPIRRS
jgi:drug/metabolite transporter (DMT)-like permease